ncbi:MAG TPA: ATP-binding protein [Dongiaceae bacterium]|nr:ATP-binding protein [Dongiaceae bacterium]
MPLIAVIDDRITNRSILTKLAASLGEDVAVRAFADPRSALEWAADHTPDLVITDYKMPKLDGAEFVRQFRKLPLCFDVPVVVVTVYEDRDFRYRALEAGATDFLISPVDHHEFRTRVRNLLTLRRQQEIIRKRALTLEEKLVLTNRLRVEEVQESRERLGSVIDTVPAMICATDAEGRCVFVNFYQCDFFRIDPKEAAGKPIAELFGEDYAERHRELDARVFATGRVQQGFEEIIADCNGQPRVFLTTKAPLNRQTGEVINVVSVSLDITERKQAEYALARAKDEAESANRSKSEFLANTSHELRTPLNAIIGFAEMMKLELLGPIGNVRYHEYSGDILASAQHLLQIIDDLLDMSSIEAGKLKLEESIVTVPKMLRDVYRLVRGRAEDGQVRLLVSNTAGVPLLRADERKLKQVLLNLLSNSIKFTPPGGTVSITAGLNEAGGLRFMVSDTGVGMAEQDIPTAKARFGRVSKSPWIAHPGTGLGLSLAVELTQLHGGTLDISSAVGTGTSVTVDLPAERCIRQASHV